MLRRAQDGDLSALDDLVVLARGLVRAKAQLIVARREAVDDVEQEVWVALVRRFRDIRDPACVIGWLLIVTRHAALRVAADLGRTLPTNFSDDRWDRLGETHAADLEDSVLDLVAQRQVHEALGRAVTSLGERDLALMTALAAVSDGRQHRYATVSAQTGMPIGSIGPTRMRILAKLRAHPDVAALA